MKIPFRYYPPLSTKKFFYCDFFPLKPKDLETRTKICIATKSRALGDALLLSGLPRKLKARYPTLKIYTYSLGFNPIVFQANPWIDGITYRPGELFGDDINEGSGQLIATKERFFDLEVSAFPKPEIYFSKKEIKKQPQAIQRTRPLILLHPFGGTCQNVLPSGIWSDIANQFSSRIQFIQIGVKGQTRIPGCENIRLFEKTRWSARDLFLLMNRADGLIGVDSGPMHVARALNKPALIFSDYCEIEMLFSNLKNHPYYLFKNYNQGCLYEDNTNYYVGNGPSKETLLEQVYFFLIKGLGLSTGIARDFDGNFNSQRNTAL